MRKKYRNYFAEEKVMFYRCNQGHEKKKKKGPGDPGGLFLVKPLI